MSLLQQHLILTIQSTPYCYRYEYYREQRGVETSYLRILMTLPLHRPHTRTKLKGIIEIHEKIRAENVNETMKRLYR
jgi:hypothetical protein